MKLPPTLAELQQEHVVMELECIDRMYLNAYVPQLTSEGGIAAFCRHYLGHRFASTKQAVPRTKAFVAAIHEFIERERVELVRFKKGQRKDAVMMRVRQRPSVAVFLCSLRAKINCTCSGRPKSMFSRMSSSKKLRP